MRVPDAVRTILTVDQTNEIHRTITWTMREMLAVDLYELEDHAAEVRVAIPQYGRPMNREEAKLHTYYRRVMRVVRIRRDRANR